MHSSRGEAASNGEAIEQPDSTSTTTTLKGAEAQRVVHTDSPVASAPSSSQQPELAAAAAQTELIRNDSSSSTSSNSSSVLSKSSSVVVKETHAETRWAQCELHVHV